MASEYLKWKYRDVKPEEKAELTPAEQRRNWLHYHKWHMAAAAVLLAVLGSILWNALARVEPDYAFAYVGKNPLPEDAAAALESALASLGEDLNGDGRVAVSLRQYVDGDPQTAAAASVTLMGDLLACESFFFLLEDPEAFQEAYGVLCRPDGSPPSEDAGALALPWPQCPVLAGLELGGYAYPVPGGTASGRCQDVLSRLYVARRQFLGEKTAPHPEGCEALWNRLTEGAVS